MGINLPSKNPVVMENDLRNQVLGITQAGADWPTTAPSPADVTATADAIQAKLAQVEASEATLSQLRAELRELVEVTAKGQYTTIRDVAKAMFKPILAAFGLTGRKEPAKRPVPAAPFGLAAHEMTATSIALQWEPSANATFYTVYVGETANTSAMSPAGNPTASQHTVDGLEEGKQYFFAVQAVNSTGASPFSNVTNRRTL